MNGSPVAGVVRGWVRLYTRGLPAELRDARRDELDDDLWCEHEEAAALGRSERSLGADLALRLVFGMPADIRWRMAHRASAPSGLERRSSTGARVVGLLVIGAVSALASHLILSSMMGEDAFWKWGGALVLLFGWPIAFISAALGVLWLLHDRVGPLGGLGALVVTAGVFTMFAGFIAPVFVGSAMLTWDLARLRVVPRLVPIVQVAVLIEFLAPNALGGPMFILYLLTLIGIGVSLIRGVPLPGATNA